MPIIATALRSTIRALRSPALWRMYAAGERNELVRALKSAVATAPPNASWTELLNKLYYAVERGENIKFVEHHRIRLYEMLRH